MPRAVGGRTQVSDIIIIVIIGFPKSTFPGQVRRQNSTYVLVTPFTLMPGLRRKGEHVKEPSL